MIGISAVLASPLSLLADLKPVHSRHHQVKQNYVNIAVARDLQAVGPAKCLNCYETLTLEMAT